MTTTQNVMNESHAANPRYADYSRLVKATWRALAKATTEEEATAIYADFNKNAKPGDWADLETMVLDGNPIRG